MKQLLLILLLLLSLEKTGFCQHKTKEDSLLQELSPTMADTSKVLLYLKLYYAIHRTDLEKAIQYAQKAKQLSEEIKFTEGLAKSNYRLGAEYIDLRKFEKATKTLHSSIFYSKVAKDSSTLGEAYSALADLYTAQSEFDSATFYYVTALAILEQQHSLNGVARIHNALGNLYKIQRQYHKSLSHYKKALAMVQNLDFLPGISACLNNIGGVYGILHQYDTALIFLEKALKIKVQTGDRLGKARVLHELGNINRLQKNYARATTYFEKSLTMAREVNTPELIVLALYSLGYNELEKENYGEAIRYARQVLEQPSRKLPLMVENRELLALAYAARKEYAKAYQHLALSKTYSDSLYNQHMLQTTNELEARYQNEKKEKKIAALSAAREINSLKLQKRKNERNYLIGLAILILVLGIVLWSRYRIKEKANKKLRELDHLRSRFFANISHEFRTPLTLLLGPLGQLQKKDFEGDRQALYRIMQRNSERLLHMVNQLLDLSKIESGQMKLQASEIQLNNLLKTISAAYESLAKNKDIQFNFQEKQKRIRLYADRDKLEKILHNLLSNAFKFTEKGGAVILSANTCSANGKSCAEITIADTGTGIADYELDKIFDRFYQADSGHTYKSQGTGIGLALTKELVALHRGEINVNSQPGEGTIFTLVLPLGKSHLPKETFVALAENPPAKTEIPSTVFSDNSTTAKTSMKDEAAGMPALLVVEDNEDMRQFLCHTLHPHFRLTEAANGREGLEKAEALQPDLVLSDVMMPEIDGVELCRRLKQDENTSHIPVVLLTAKSDKVPKIEGLETGADDYLTKPFDADELIALLQNRIRQRALLRERFSKEITLQPAAIAITGADEKFLRKAMEVVEDNMEDFDFNVQELICRMELGRSQVEHKLKALAGQTPVTFIRLMRLKRAAQKIAQKEDTITRIAYSVGFNNLSYFAKCFKEQFGQAPSEYGR